MFDDDSQKELRIADLIAKFLQGTISAEESDELNAWIESSARNKTFFQDLCNTNLASEVMPYLNKDVDLEAAWAHQIKRRDVQTNAKWRANKVRMIGYAAILLLAIATPLVYTLVIKDRPEDTYSKINHIRPGSHLAILTTENGKRIEIDENQTLQIANGITVIKDHGIHYTSKSNMDSRAMHEIKVPLKCNFEILLQDGTHVWLNAGSSLRFPVVFTGVERKVLLQGEGYFQVAHNKSKPFFVQCRNTLIEAVGTAFNVNGYTDSVTTTLVEGIVNVANKTSAMKLYPGNSATVYPSSVKQISKKVSDTALAKSWLQKDFIFEHTPITLVMEEIERWYGVHVKYNTDYNKAKLFTGEISRNVSLLEFMQLLNTTGIADYKIEQNNITLLPYRNTP